MKTTLFYGPWQCRREFMRSCQAQCTRAGHPLRGCLWLADLKFDWEGQVLVLPVPVSAGSRYGIFHCCYDHPTLPKATKEAARKNWDRIRDSFREDWSKRFGQWPSEAGTSWPGHHIWDLWHDGDPVDPNNIIPVQPHIHEDFNRAYPACYSGQAPWNTPGADLPYRDH